MSKRTRSRHCHANPTTERLRRQRRSVRRCRCGYTNCELRETRQEYVGFLAIVEAQIKLDKTWNKENVLVLAKLIPGVKSAYMVGDSHLMIHGREGVACKYKTVELVNEYIRGCVPAGVELKVVTSRRVRQ